MTVSIDPPRAGDLALAHAVADHLAAAELDLFPVGCEVTFNLDHKIGVGQAHAVAGGGAEHRGIGGAGKGGGHRGFSAAGSGGPEGAARLDCRSAIALR
jgi:hypothetical protein